MPTIDGIELRHSPFKHQLDRWRAYRDKPNWAHFWEQGTGKSCVSILEAASLYEAGEIDGILIIAPSGVHSNWVEPEGQFDEHWPTNLPKPNLCLYRSKSSGTKWHQRELERAMTCPGMSVLAMTYDATDTNDREPKLGGRRTTTLGGKSWAKRFLTERRVMLIADESSRIKSPKARRTVIACKAAAHAKYRRLLNGTPVTNGPFDLYTQVCFLDPAPFAARGRQIKGNFWISKGITSYHGFCAQFGVFETAYAPDGRGGTRTYQKLVKYRNLELLAEWMTEISDRVTKDEVLDLPPKLYTRMAIELSPAQRRVYDQLRDESMTRLDSGELVTIDMALIQLLRLQQVCSGYVAVDDPEGEPVVNVGNENPRLDVLLDVCEDLGHKAIIWTRFKRDIDLITQSLTTKGLTWVRYDGTVDDDGRIEAKRLFRASEAQFFVSNAQVGGEGLTLLGDQSDESMACRTVIYYTNDFNLQRRLQSEDRAHRIGQRWPVNYIDIVASGTVDEHIVKCLKAKFDIAQQVTGDDLREWLT